ncbi:DUF302 domain-containing protein [Thauera linaloolentis]|uniref:DUF302 domain-containing protein n=1 Tax=Thauera linaloolentis (strain DSM 12138 / JCM 21573 / CCUG 41526 / CIP 105981 / IAM 15112 / NBRC 102519 / 47Lol) TaxID=1123367 RepID=N6Y6K6_THAL4|nr:DUF302 domain-containing protein [Thauera linaloolentis]ENO87215.1 hypothetical protein C666_11495 [Thauera linaloolentis 47Lol = DSM 12138]MCM8567368.1 DUF302 domain-containing protein [Thauera linaloolentis]
MIPTRPTPSRRHGLLRRGAGFLAALFVFAAQGASAAADIVTREIPATEFEDVAFAVVDAIAAEGITPPTVSHFGDMLRRTAPDLGHSPDTFAEARIYTFCSASAAARLSAESPHHIALCPLSIAVYRLRADSPVVHVGYRRSAATPGGARVDALLERIVARAADALR